MSALEVFRDDALYKFTFTLYKHTRRLLFEGFHSPHKTDVVVVVVVDIAVVVIV